jgi:hypothetical protein
LASDESWVIIRDKGRGLVSQPVENVVGIAVLAPEVEQVSDPEPAQALYHVRNAFQDKRMEPIARMGIGTGQSLINEERQAGPIGQLGGVEQRMVPANAPIHLRPIQYVFRAASKRRLIQISDMVFHPPIMTVWIRRLQ